METFCKEAVQRGELVLYEILGRIADKYNRDFSTLQLPKALSIDRENRCLVLPFYKGETFNDIWLKENGGRSLGLDLAIEVPAIIKDLSVVDTSRIEEDVEIKKLSRIRFDQLSYLEDFEVLCGRFIDFDLITAKEASTAISLMREPYTSRIIFNNGDFYPRNFIRTANDRIVVIDWETWNPHSPAYVLDHLENVAAYCLVHMWGNIEWQHEYIKELKRIIHLDRDDFQKGIVAKSADIAAFWFRTRMEATLDSPMILFKRALDSGYLNQLWA